MISQPKITEQITADILARSTAGEDPIVAIFDSLTLANVNWRSITSDEVKPILVQAIRASRGARVNASKPSCGFSTSVGINGVSQAPA